MFEIKSDRRVPLDGIGDPRLRRLLAYWVEKRAGRLMPSWSDLSLEDLAEHVSRLHVLDYEGPGRLRFRIYGGAVTNPEVRDMTGLTTQDYEDTRFGGLVTRHYQECVDRRLPICRHVVASLRGEPYEYFRLTLPLSDDARSVNMLMASPVRVTVPVPLPGEKDRSKESGPQV